MERLNRELKKRSLLVAIILIGAFFLVIFYRLFVFKIEKKERSSLSVSPTPTSFQPSPSFHPVTPKIPKRIYVSGVSVRNFYQSAEIDFSKTYELINNKDYRITFVPQKNLFFVVIYNSPFDKKRKEAESALINLLDIDKEHACLLNVKIVTSPKVDPKEGGKYHPLSFCQKLIKKMFKESQ